MSRTETWSQHTVNIIHQSSGYAIRATGVEQRFGRGPKAVHALRGVDLEIEAGTVYGLLGHNGAGKTTLVNILTTLVPAAGGRASVAGFDVERDAKQVRARIGLTGQYAAVDEDLTGRENLRMIGRLLGMPKRTADTRSRELLERFDLADASERRAATYSGGMRRRLDLAASLVGQPEVLFLDEPTTGLDPSSRVELWDVIAQLVDLGTTVLLTTQYLEEADRLADQIGVLDAGLMIAEGTAAELKSKVGGHVVEVTVGDGEALRSACAALGNRSAAIDELTRTVTVPVEGAGDVAPIVRALDDRGVTLTGLQLHEPTLDDVFFALTGARHVDDEVSPAA
ncbi:MAG TPA: ATP-binding cassette domain-containing protein [Acidimicrobiia bacterium]|jgi:ABC-2 type transport system ATP-binding protein